MYTYVSENALRKIEVGLANSVEDMSVFLRIL